MKQKILKKMLRQGIELIERMEKTREVKYIKFLEFQNETYSKLICSLKHEKFTLSHKLLEEVEEAVIYRNQRDQMVKELHELIENKKTLIFKTKVSTEEIEKIINKYSMLSTRINGIR